MGNGLSSLKNLDIYRDIPKDLTEQTTTGAVVSIVCAIFIIYLFTSEFLFFLTPEITQEMFVEESKYRGNDHELLQINLNITVPAVPCAVVSVDAQDIMGSHVVDVGGELKKTRLDKLGRVVVDVKTGQPALAEGPGIEPGQQKGEGCNVHGYMIVKRVPGNFHLSAHAHSHLLSLFFSNDAMNLSHVVHELTFGTHATSNFADLGDDVTNALKGTSKIVYENKVNEAKSFEYYIKIVPMIYKKLNGDVLDSFQYVSNSNEILGRYAIPALYFRYDLSPITVKFTKKSRSFAHFCVQICAIVGGVFTVLGLFNSLIHSSLKHVLKKAQMNKLG